MATKRKTPGINGSSSADIAFMLLIFFLITTSMDTDKGLKRRLPPMAPKQQKQQEIEINDRNIMRLLVNRADEIVISRKDASGIDQLIPVKLEQLKDYAVEFIMNPDNKPFLPELERREIEGLGERTVVTTGYAISIKNEVETSYQQYVNVQNELIKAYNEVWDTFARQAFGKPFEALTPSQKKSVTDAYPMHISEMALSNLAKK
ncbi:biopolymer transporter ExbD [Porphyromonas sp. oral taxon 278]|uniref:ExbD/TolR family protein n=1 Tax=Porphyromonas sp. oral taxon 278 TaxID=712437 RepID=UPI0025EADE2C|nr:biopolymer transporter ExbD [Porphyromonas sp. oral taxon 278]